MKIKIIKTSDSLYWYSKYLNEEFIVQKEDLLRYWCREPNEWGALNFILKEDAEVVDHYG